MQYALRALCVLLFAVSLAACGGGLQDKEGKKVKAGELYRMTKDGLVPVPYLTDVSGNKLEPGKLYEMTPKGLEPTVLKDRAGHSIQVGNEYIATDEGLKLVLKRNIHGAVTDSAGKAVGNVTVSLADSPHKTLTSADGRFSLPFVEGYAKLVFEVPDLPAWCKLDSVENTVLSRDQHPGGWDVGVVKLPCALASNRAVKPAWATADGSFVDNGDGTVTDVKNKLMWEARIQDQNVTRDQAAQYVKGLSLGGRTDWRLPTAEQLQGLYEANVACGWHGPSLISGGINVWSAEQPDPTSAVIVNLCNGQSRKSKGLDEGEASNPSVLAVRFVK